MPEEIEHWFLKKFPGVFEHITAREAAKIMLIEDIHDNYQDVKAHERRMERR